jgi:uncharacterized protein
MLLTAKQLFSASISSYETAAGQHPRGGNTEMTTVQILLTGSSGFIGTSLVRKLRQERISTISLHRRSLDGGKPSDADSQEIWDPYATTPVSDSQRFAGVTAAIHLSGANVAGRRWTSFYKREILESRVKPTHALAVMLSGLRPRPAVLVCASAIGLYGSRGDEVLTEASLPGTGFLPEVCLAWEKAAQPAIDAGIRVVHLRFGVVLSPEGGALAKMLPVFRAGLGGQLGSGRQWLSWITLPDVIRAIEFARKTTSLSGAVNVVTPNPVTNAEFTRLLGRAIHRPTLLPVPAFALRLAFGEMAEASVLASERVMPARLEDAGFQFEFPDLAAGLEAILA